MIKTIRKVLIISSLSFLLPLLIGGGVIISMLSVWTMKSESSWESSNSSDVSGLLPGTLNAFSFFCYYESGGDYDCDGGEAYGAYQLDYRYELQTFIDWCYASDKSFYSAFAPYTSSSCDKSTLLNNSAFANVWHQLYKADSTKFSKAQDDFKYTYGYKPLEETAKSRYGIDLSSRPKVIQGECLSIANRKGSEYFYRALSQSGITNETSNEEFIRKICNTFATLDGRSQGNIVYDRWLVDYSSAACGVMCEMNMALAILKGGTVSGGGTAGSERMNNVPYYCQHDYPNVAFDGGTVADSGCGITSFSMVASYFTGRSITPEETAPWAMANGADTVINWGSFSILANHYGIKMTAQVTGPLWGGDASQAINALRNGCLVIGSHTNGYFNPSGRGHYIVYTGVTTDGRVYVNDPASRENSSAGAYDLNTAFSHCKQYWIFSK